MVEKSHLVLTQEAGVTVVSFREPTILDAYHVNEIAKELYALVSKASDDDSQECHHKIVLDLSSIKMLSSQSLGVFLTMRQKREIIFWDSIAGATYLLPSV